MSLKVSCFVFIPQCGHGIPLPSWSVLSQLLYMSCQCVWVCPHPESIRGQFHPAPQCSPTLGQLGHRELHFETHFSHNMETKPPSIEYTGRWCLPRVRRTVQCSAVNQEGEARRGRRCDPLRGSALSSHSASYLAPQDHHLCPCCTKYLLHVSILQSKHVLSTVCYACYAQDKKSPFLLSQNQE